MANTHIYQGDTAGGDLAGTYPSPTIGSISGVTTNSNASAGKVGEYVTANASSVSVSTATAKTITSISLTAGDWDVRGNLTFIAAASTVPTLFLGGTSSTDNTLPSSPDESIFQLDVTTTTAGTTDFPVGVKRFSLATTTTIYLVAQVTFTVSTMTVNGIISARRVR